jgi:DNA polymerase-1
MGTYIDKVQYPFYALSLGVSPIAIDTETLGNTRELNLPIYYSWAATDLPSGAGPTTTPAGFEFLTALCASPRPKIFHHAKFDLEVLKKIELVVNGEIHDTILMHGLLDEHHIEAHRLKALSRELLGSTREDELELKQLGFGRKNVLNNRIPQEKLHEYSMHDADDTLALYQLFVPSLKEFGLWELYRSNVATELIYGQIDERGIAMDEQALDKSIQKITKALESLTTQIYHAFNEKFLITSPTQLGNVLVKHFPLTERTPDGHWCTDKQVLNRWIIDPRIQLLAAHKFLSKACSTLAGYRKLIVNGRVHPDYRQTTTTGRSACRKPNLQNVPKQRGRLTEIEVGTIELATTCSEAFRQTRKVFRAADGAVLVAKDYKQVEYRIFAYYSQSQRLVTELKAGADFHELTCRLVFEDYNDRLRHIIKIINYGLIYGMGDELLRTQISLADPKIGSQDTLRRYEQMLPEMRSTQRLIRSTAQKRGYVRDVFGRMYRYLEERPHAIVSWLCQGTAAGIKKQSLIRVNDLVQSTRSGIVADVHDEIITELYREDAFLIPEFKRVMEDYPQFGSVPILIDISVGVNLLEMKKLGVEEAVSFVNSMI